MAAIIQIKRRIGSAGAPTALAEGELAYHDNLTANDLYVGSTPAAVRTLVGATRQVEIAGAQTITGVKTIAVANLKVTGGTAGQALTTDGTGNLNWAAGGAAAGALPPVMDGVAAPGVAVPYSREDHVHPTDTSRAPLASPVFTGDPQAPTPAPGNSSVSIATTAFVTAATTALPVPPTAGATPPVMDGAAAAGVAVPYSREDHVHPSDTSRVPFTGGAMTGILSLSGAPVALLDATTKQYVDQAVALGQLWMGTYAVATNTPAGPPATPDNGDAFTAVTANPNVPEALTVAWPPLIIGTMVSNGDLLKFNGTDWTLIPSSGMTQSAADARYMSLTTANLPTGRTTFAPGAAPGGTMGITGGAAGNVLSTDGAGNLSWITPTVAAPVSITAADPAIVITPSPLVGTGTIGLANTAVTPGTYNGAYTVDAKGRITTALQAVAGTVPVLTDGTIITGTGLTGAAITLGNTAVVPGSYTGAITVDAQGRVTTAANSVAGDTAVAVDATLAGNGLTATPLSVLSWAAPRAIGIVGTVDTVLAMTPASVDGTANADITDFDITGLNGGTY